MYKLIIHRLSAYPQLKTKYYAQKINTPYSVSSIEKLSSNNIEIQNLI